AEWAATEMVRLMRAWAGRHGIPFTANSAGTMWGSFFTDATVRDYATAKLADTKRYGRVFHGLLDAGVYLAPSQFEAGFTSISHDAGVMAEVAEALDRVTP
ncbi:MAG: aspartate aminotransferase family protein, partial [Gemmatimonadaceae bacterium]